MKIYGIYDLNNNEQCVRVGTLLEIKNFLQLTTRSLHKFVKTKILYRQYELVFLFEEVE